MFVDTACQLTKLVDEKRTVSYTHLDVYKRQVWGGPMREGLERHQRQSRTAGGDVVVPDPFGRRHAPAFALRIAFHGFLSDR